FETLQFRQERQAEQVFRQRLVGQHHGVDVAHHETADLDAVKPGARGLDGAVRGRNNSGVLVRHGTQAEPRGGGFVQRNHGGAGIDHEGDALAVDAAFGGEMTAEIAGNAECTVAAGFALTAVAVAGVILSAICAMKTPRPPITAAVITMLRMTPLYSQNASPDFTTSAATSRSNLAGRGRHFREKDERSVNTAASPLPVLHGERSEAARSGASG